MSVQELDSQLSAKQFHPLYAILGEETYIAGRALSLLLGALHQHGSHDLSTRTYDAHEMKSASDVIVSLTTIPLLGGGPVVIIRDAERLKKNVQEELAEYVAHPVSSSTLIIVASKLDGRSRLMIALKKRGMVVECKPLYAHQVASWISIESKRHEKKIAHEAARYLADLVGTDMGQIADALERLVLFIGERPLIEVKDIEEVIAETAQRTVFEFTDAVGERDRTKALSVLRNLLEQGESPVGVLAMLTRHIRLLLKARELHGKHPSETELARTLNIHPFFAKNYLKQSQKFSTQELRQSFRLLSETDRSLKSSKIPRSLLLENVLLKLI